MAKKEGVFDKILKLLKYPLFSVVMVFSLVIIFLYIAPNCLAKDCNEVMCLLVCFTLFIIVLLTFIKEIQKKVNEKNEK